MRRLKSKPKMTSSVQKFIIRSHHTALSVNDFEVARDFFVDVIGMHLESEINYRDEDNLGVVVGLPNAAVQWALLEMNGYRIELFKYYNPTGVRYPMQQCDIGLTHICFQVSNVHEVHSRLVTNGYKTISAPRALRGGQSIPFYLVGPDQIIIEFIEIHP